MHTRVAGRHVVSTRPAPSLWRPAHAVWPDWTFTVGAVPRVPTGLSCLAAGSEGESGGWLARGRGWWAKPGGTPAAPLPGQPVLRQVLVGPALPVAVSEAVSRGVGPWGMARPDPQRRGGVPDPRAHVDVNSWVTALEHVRTRTPHAS